MMAKKDTTCTAPADWRTRPQATIDERGWDGPEDGVVHLGYPHPFDLEELHGVRLRKLAHSEEHHCDVYERAPGGPEKKPEEKQ